MIEKKILHYFERYPELKILFFFDENREFQEEVNNLVISNIHIEIFDGNEFTTKCKLLNELSDTKVLLYLPFAHPSTQDEYHAFSLLGLLLANKELKLDNIGEFMETYGLQRHQKQLVSKYIKELKYSGVQMVCEPILNTYGFEEQAIQRGILSYSLKFKTIEGWPVITAKLLSLLVSKEESELNKVLSKIADLRIQDTVVQKISENTSYQMQSLSREELLQCARCILYNRITQTILSVSNKDPYSSFKIKDQTQIVRLNQMIIEVERYSNIKDSLDELMHQVSSDIRGDKLIEAYGLDANFTEFTNSMIWAIILNLQSQISVNPEIIIHKTDSISLQHSVPESLDVVLKYLSYVAKLHQMVNSITSYIFNKPQDYTKAYTEELYFIDEFFRKAIKSYKQIDHTELNSDFQLEIIHSEFNKKYDNHTDTLNREWLKCLNQFEFDYASLPVLKQYEFYKNEIEPLNQKVVVFISDALRYEVAQELLSELHNDVKNTAKLRYMMASIPSKTNIGMAQLLPSSDLSFNNGDIKNAGISTEGLSNRTTILKKIKEDSLAVQYSDITSNSQEKNREIFKNSVVYIYHDVIDSTGDKRASERRTFDVISQAIDEIKRLVKSLHATYNVTKVFITADHGFLYNDKEIEDKDLESIVESNPVADHNRYFISNTPSNQPLGYSIPISKTTAFKDTVFVTIPHSVNRYRKQGVGHQFVHGGGSLQEVVIPIIESSRKREDVVNKVKPTLIKHGDLKIVSNVLRFNLLQSTKVSRLEKEVSLSIGIFNNNVLVSNEVILTMNSTSEPPTERATRVELIMVSDVPKNDFLKLKVFDIDDRLNPIIEEHVQNNTLIQSDF